MEEILASIRRIISEDSGTEEAPPASEAVAPPPPPEPEFEPEPEPEPVEDDILELTEALPEEPAPQPAPAAALPASDFDEDDIQFAEPVAEPEPAYEPLPEPAPVYQPAPAPAVATGIAPQPAPIEEEPETAFEEPVMSADSAPSKASPLLSSDTESAASAAFGALASSLMTSSGGSRTLDELVGDLLRPMLKEWLDENLPSLVERLVAEEIERVARRKG